MTLLFVCVTFASRRVGPCTAIGDWGATDRGRGPNHDEGQAHEINHSSYQAFWAREVAVRQVDQRGVSHTRGPARRGASASSRLRVHRTLPSREKPPGTRQPAPATTTTSAKAGRRRSAAGTPRRITQFLQSRGRMRGRPIKRTLRGRRARVRRLSRQSRAVRQLHALLMPSRQLRGGLPAHGTRRSNDVGFLRIRHPQG